MAGLLQTFRAPNVVASTPDEVARQRAYADALLSAGMDVSDIQRPIQGFANLAQAFIGGRQRRAADSAERTGNESAATSRNALLQALLNPGGSTSAPMTDPQINNNATVAHGVGAPAAAVVPGVGAPSPTASPSGSGGQDALLQAMLSLGQNPWASSGDTSMVNSLIGQRLAQNAPVTPIEINNRLVNPQTGQVIGDYSDPQDPMVVNGQIVNRQSGEIQGDYRDPTDHWQDLTTPDERQAAGIATTDNRPYQINTRDGELRGVGSGGTNVTVSGPQGAYDAGVGKNDSDFRNAIVDGEANATSQLAQLNVMKTLIADPNFYSGAGNDFVQGLRRVGVALGIANPDSVSSGEAFAAQAAQATLNLLGGSLGTGISSTDRDFIQAMTANPSFTPQGNLTIIGIQEALARRQQEIGQLYRQYVGADDNGDGTPDHPRVDDGFRRLLVDYGNSHPLDLSGVPNLQQPGAANPQAPASPNNDILGPPTVTGNGFTIWAH